MSLTHIRTLHPAAADRSGDRLAKRCPKMDPRIDPTWMPERFQVDPGTTPKPCPNDSNTNPEWLRSDSQNTPQLSPSCCWHLLLFCIYVYAYMCLLILIVGSSWHLLTFPHRAGICWHFCIIVAESCWFVCWLYTNARFRSALWVHFDVRLHFWKVRFECSLTSNCTFEKCSLSAVRRQIALLKSVVTMKPPSPPQGTYSYIAR